MWCSVAIFLTLLVTGSLAQDSACGKNERLFSCGACDLHCALVRAGQQVSICTTDCRPIECGCVKGHARHENGECVPKSACELLAQTSECGVTSENEEMFPPTDFAFDMYRSTKHRAEGNIFFSPVSISLAVGMLHQGTRGQTATEIEQTFFPSIEANQSVPAFTNLMGAINREDKEYALDTANAIFTKEGGPALDATFLNTVKTCFSSEIEMKPFGSQPEAARQEINKWVENKTQNLIEDFFPQGIINTKTEMVLVNAIYFKGQWLKEFDEAMTRPKVFKGTSETFQVDMMHSSGDFLYHEDKQNGFKVLKLPYKGEELSMVIFLPETTKDFYNFEQNMTGDLMRSAMEKMTSEKINTVAIPKFKVEYKLPLEDVMKDMGVTSMFASGLADLSGITRDKRLFVSDAVHKAVIEVNEQGSEAAAATGSVPSATSIRVLFLEFVADKPFVYLIVMKKQHTILFQGSLVGPPQEQA